MSFHCVISNFEKKKTFSPEVFKVESFFMKRVSCIKMEPKGNLVELRMFVKYGLTKLKKLHLRCLTWF